MTRISVLVPTFNRAQYLVEALDAIVAELGPDDEALVIDDGSSDATADVVQTFAGRVRYLYQANAGKAAALNRGLAHASGEFICICDDDDVLRPQAFETLLAGFAERPEAGFVFGRYQRFAVEDGVRKMLSDPYWPDLSAGSLNRHMLEDAFVFQNATLARAAAYRAVGPFSETLPRSLDYEMFTRLAVSHVPHFVDKVIFDQRQHDGARGPAAHLHAATAMEDVWRTWDRVIFAHAHTHLPIALFEGMFESADHPLIRRTALLQRGTIMARHACWPQALSDFELAASADPRPLEPVEQAVLRRALDSKLGLSATGDPHAIESLRKLRQGSPLGRRMVDAMLVGAAWRLRRPRVAEWRQAFATIAGIAGSSHALALVARPRLRGLQGGEVLERETVAPSALLAPGTLPPVGAAKADGLPATTASAASPRDESVVATDVDQPRRYRRPGRLAAIAALVVLLAVAIGSLLLARFGPSDHTSPSAREAAIAEAQGPPKVEETRLLDVAPATAKLLNAEKPFADAAPPPAAAFKLKGSADDRARAIDCLAAAEWYEAGDDASGEKAVAQVILNRARHPAFPGTVCGVVFQGSERSTGCQFTFTCDGALGRVPSEAAWKRARALAEAAIDGTVDPRVGTATHYHADYVVPYWRDSLDKIAQVGAHIFYRWQGYWGTRPAFRRNQLSAEPAVPKMARISEVHRDAVLAAGGTIDLGLPLAGASDTPMAMVLPPPPPIAVEGVREKSLRKAVVRAVDANSFFIQLDPAIFAGNYATAAVALCKNRSPCRVYGWLDPGKMATAAPATGAQAAALSFLFQHDDTNGDKALWACEQVPRNNPAQCLPNDKAARAALIQ